LAICPSQNLPTDSFDEAFYQWAPRDEFLALQIEKLMENSLNQKVAIALLRQKKSEHPEDQLSLN
jgi:hypothetical protein